MNFILTFSPEHYMLFMGLNALLIFGVFNFQKHKTKNEAFLILTSLIIAMFGVLPLFNIIPIIIIGVMFVGKGMKSAIDYLLLLSILKSTK